MEGIKVVFESVAHELDGTKTKHKMFGYVVRLSDNATREFVVLLISSEQHPVRCAYWKGTKTLCEQPYQHAITDASKRLMESAAQHRAQTRDLDVDMDSVGTTRELDALIADTITAAGKPWCVERSE